MKHVTFQINLHLLVLSSSHPFSAPIAAWRAFSPRASLSFLARRTCCFLKPDAKILGNIQNLHVNALYICGYLQLVQIFTFTKSKVCSKSTKIYVPIGQQLRHVLCKLGLFRSLQQSSLCRLPYVWTDCLVPYYAVFRDASSSTVNKAYKDREQIHSFIHCKSWCLGFSIPQKVIINIQPNNESPLSAPWIFVSFSPWHHRSDTQNRTHKGVGLVLQKGTLYLKDPGTSPKSPQQSSFSGWLLHASGCVLSALGISNDNGTSIMWPFELILIGLTARAKLRIRIAIMMNNSLIHTPWLFIVAGRYRVNQLPFQQ